MATIASTRFGGKVIAQSVSGVGNELTDIKRNAIQSGNPNQIVVNNNAGNLTSVAVLDPELGGTGIDSSAATGVAVVSSGNWSVGTLTDSNISASADISRSKLADGTADHIVVNAGDGSMSSTAVLNPARGGTGIDSSAASGVARVSAGVWSVGQISNSDIQAGAAIDRSKLATGVANAVLINSGTGQMSEETVLAVSRGGLGANFSGAGVGPFAVQLSSGVFTNVAAGDLAVANTFVKRNGAGASSFNSVITPVVTSGTSLTLMPTGALNISAGNGISQGSSDVTSTPNSIAGGKTVVYTRNVQTTDATQTTLWTLPTSAGGASGTAYHISVGVTCGDTTGGSATATIAYTLRGKNVGGVVSVSADTGKTRLREAALNTVDVNTVISGTNILIRVKGKAATTVKWAGRFIVVSQEF